MAQWGFMVNTDNCVGCKACEVACKQRNGLKPGDARLRTVSTVENGEFPDVQVHHFSMSCMHCAEPACMAACPAGAIVKDDDGAVLGVRERCIGCQSCYAACPWGVPSYREEDGTMIKCDLCADRRAMGLDPACAHTCFFGGLRAGDLDDLMSQVLNPDAAQMMEGETTPSVIIVG